MLTCGTKLLDFAAVPPSGPRFYPEFLYRAFLYSWYEGIAALNGVLMATARLYWDAAAVALVTATAVGFMAASMLSRSPVPYGVANSHKLSKSHAI